jgi:hypothetical protein
MKRRTNNGLSQTVGQFWRSAVPHGDHQLPEEVVVRETHVQMQWLPQSHRPEVRNAASLLAGDPYAR